MCCLQLVGLEVFLCVNSYSFVIWAGKSSTKRNIHSKLYFYTSREFLNSKHQRFDSQPHYGHKDQEIREKTSQRLCHSFCHLQEILGSRIRLKTIMELSPAKWQRWDKDSLLFLHL